MPLDTKPVDKPAAVRFRVSAGEGAFEVTCSLLQQKKTPPYRIEGGALRFENRDAFKARVVQVGLTPAVAEDQGRSFNATARQLRELGFQVDLGAEQDVKERKAEEKEKTADQTAEEQKAA